MLSGNTIRCAAATPAALRPSPAGGALATPSPADEALAAFRSVESWVRAGAAPDSFPDPAPFAASPAAACVTLRLDGRVIGRASVVGDGPAPRVLYDAAYDAIRQAERRVPRPLVPGEHSAWDRVTISLELAGPPVPLTPGELAAVDASLSLGLDGVAARLGDRTRATFPGELLERASSPSAAVAALAAELAPDPAAAMGTPAELAARGFTVLRIRATHLAQPGPGLGPVFLHRGGTVRPPLDGQALRALADAVAKHLCTREWPGVEAYGLMGTLRPTLGRYEPAIADPVEQAVMAVALLRAARTPGIDPETASDAGAVAVRTLRALAKVEPDERDPAADIASAAAALWALAELPDALRSVDEALRGLGERCRAALTGAFDPGSGWNAAVPPELRGFVALGLVADGLARGLPPAGLDEIVRATFRDTAPERLIGQMPWLAWADMRLADAANETVKSAEALRALRDIIAQHRLRAGDLSADDRDLAGGIVFTRGVSPLPGWQSLRAHALLASMLARPELTPGTVREGDFPRELVGVLEGLRFAAQLSADTSACWLYARPDKAVGGVRVALWDSRMPPEASALTLLACTETLSAAQAAAERAQSIAE